MSSTARAIDAIEASLRTALQAANVGLWDWDVRTNSVYFSREWKRQIGYGERELPDTYEEFRSRLHPDDAARVLAETRAFLDGAAGAEFRCEFRFRHRDGSWRWILSQASVLKDRQGRPERMLGAHVDITARKQAELALETANARLRAVLDSMFTYVGVFSLDGIVLEGSTGPIAAAGLSRDDVIGKPFLDSFYFAHSPAAREQVSKALDRARAGETVREDFSVRLAPGQVAVLDGTFTPLRDAQGRVVQIIGSAIDVTERRRAEERARASEDLNRLIIETEPECVKVVGPDGSLLQMNPAGLAMLEAETFEQARQRPLVDFVAPEHRAAFAGVHRRVMAGESGTLEFEVIGARGGRRWLETRAVPLRDAHGAVTALLGVTRDVTEAKRQRDHIQHLSRMRAVMSRINALIVRARSRAELFQEACRVAVTEGGFGLAWISLLQGAGEVVPVASFGNDGGHLAGLRFGLSGDDPRGCAHTVRAVRDGRAVVSNDIAGDEALGAWRAPLALLGYRSMAACPLIVGGRVLGCINLYSGEAGFFDAGEMELLRELSEDLSFALEFIIKDERLDLLSIYDPLTRMPNRQLFMRRLPAFIQAAQDSGRRLAVLVLDIERFKAINDAVGQAGGDALLRRVAERMTFHAGGSGYVARITGDRFAAVIANLEPGADVESRVQEAAWDRIEPPFRHGGQEFSPTFKIGVAAFPQDGANAEELLKNAELALKHGKATGRRVVRFAAAMGEAAARKLQLSGELRRAFERGELELYYQPKVDVRAGQVCGAEALLRWNSPSRGLVLPSEIIPLMEETGLILDVGRWALDQALLQGERWRAEGLRAQRIGVNVSAVQLREKSFAENVKRLLARSPWAAAALEIEVTESVMMADADANITTLRALRALGLTVAMDDFGTGYSSLAYLNRLPLNSVKIDRSFVEAMAGSPDTMSIVSSIVALAHSMNLRVVAEGVENDEQLRALRLLRCDEIQGYLFSTPLTADGYAALLRSDRGLPLR